MESFGPGVAVLLGVLEGLTEYLPVSSTGHLILLGHGVGFTGDAAVRFEICIQLGAILAVVVYERAKILELFARANRERRRAQRLILDSGASSLLAFRKESADACPHLWFLTGLGAACVPAAAVGLVAHEWIEDHLFSPRAVAVNLIIGGLIILIVETWPRPIRHTELERIGLSTAVGVGLAQCAALLPGMSRSGATIVGGLLAGMDRKVATEFSFFLAIPTMGAATGYKLAHSASLFSAHEALTLALGMLVAFLVAWAVIASFLAYVKRHTLKVFGYYRIVLGAAILLLL